MKSHRISLICMLAAVGIALAGCGSTSAGGGQAQAGAGQLVKVDYEPGGESFLFLPTLVAITQGYFTDAGIDLNYQPLLSTAALQVNAIITGQSDIGATGTTGLLTARQKGQDIVGVGYMSQTPGIVLTLTKTAADRLAAKGVTPSSPLPERVKALAGLKIASLPAGSSAQILLSSLLVEQGMKLSDVTIASVDSLPAIFNTAKNGQSDAFFDNEPFISQSVHEGWGVPWISYPAGDVPAATGIPWTEYVASGKFVKEHPDTVRAFMTAIWRADETLTTRGTDPALLDPVRQKWFAAIDPTVFKQAWEASLPLFKNGPMPSEEIFAKELTLFNSAVKPPYSIAFSDTYALGPVAQAKPS